MATTYSVTPTNTLVKDPAGTLLAVTFTVTRSGDISLADTENWSIIDDPTVTQGVEKNFFYIPSGSTTTNGEPSGQVTFRAGASQAQAPITVYLQGGIDSLPHGNDWGTFDLGVKLGVATQSTSGFSESASGGYGVTVNNYTINGAGGTLSLDYDMYTIPDQADVYLNGQEILTTGGPVSDTGNLSYSETGPAPLKAGDNVEVVITGNIQGTAWDYSLNYAPGISAVVEGHTTVDTGKPSIAELARLSVDSYNGNPAKNLNGYAPFLVSGNSIGSVAGANIDSNYAGFQAYAYQNANSSQIVIAFRGTYTDGGKAAAAKNIFSDTSWITGVPSRDFEREITDAVAFVNAVKAASSGTGAILTLTGHSLGGAVAEALGEVGSYTAVGFDAPGAQGFISTLKSDDDFNGLGVGPGGLQSNYRLYGDQVSLAGIPIGTPYTVTNLNPNSSSIRAIGDNHSSVTLASQLASGPGVISLGLLGPNYVANLQSALVGTSKGIGLQLITTAVVAGVSRLIDPATGHNFVFIENSASSPDISSVTLPYADAEGISQYRIETLVGSQWTVNAAPITPGNVFTFSPGVRGVEFVPLDSNGNAQLVPASFFEASFAATGQMSATFLTENGDETNLGDLNGDTTSDVLLQNGGTVVDWTMQNGLYSTGNVLTTGATGYKSVGAGDFNGDGTSDVLLQNGGTVVDWILKDGAYQSGNVVTTAAAGYQVVGTRDFNGDGTSDVLLQSGGTVVDWIMLNGKYQTGNVLTSAATGYTVVGAGDFNGDGTSDVLLQNGGTVVDWIMKNGKYQSGNVLTTAATGYTVVGAGDFNGDGTFDVLLQNGGTVVDWIMKNGAYQSGNVLTTGATGYSVVGTGDYNGDGTSDVLLQSGGTVVDWIMKNGAYQSGNVITTAASGFSVSPS